MAELDWGGGAILLPLTVIGISNLSKIGLKAY